MAGGLAKLLLFFALALVPIALIIAQLPEPTAQERAAFRFPTSSTDAIKLSHALVRYRDQNYMSVVTIFCAVYILLQSFAIPGPVFLSLLAGPLFGFRTAMVLVSLSATTGACVCYYVSDAAARPVLERVFPNWLSSLRQKIAARRESLLFYLIFLRISPLLPNWFINLAAAHVDIPIGHFIVATLVGLIPANYIHISTGLQLEAMGEDAESGQSWHNMVGRFVSLFLLAFVALLPTFFKSRFQAADVPLDNTKVESDKTA